MKLLEEVKKLSGYHLGDNSSGRRKTTRMIERGKAHYLGSWEYATLKGETQEKNPYFSIMSCMSVQLRLNEFWDNYRGEIISLRLRKEGRKV